MHPSPPIFFSPRGGGGVWAKFPFLLGGGGGGRGAGGGWLGLRCTADLDSKSGGATSDRKIKGTIHWVSAAQAIDAEVRLYDRLFTVADPDADGDFKSFVNPNSLELANAKCEPSLADADSRARFQFERLGYFALDPDSKPDKLVFNRTITLKDTWAKEVKNREQVIPRLA